MSPSWCCGRPFSQVVNKGVGERVPASSMTWQSVVAGITQVLADPGYAQQAAAIGASIRAAPAVQEAADRVEAFARAAGISIQAQHS
jgi:UDP:flavonoid glycosyltransferase YjiC (YdhE family)